MVKQRLKIKGLIEVKLDVVIRIQMKAISRYVHQIAQQYVGTNETSGEASKTSFCILIFF